MSWRDDAACKGHPTDWWFPEKNRGHTTQSVRARAICRDCPVSDECLAYGIRYGAQGIWGGVGGKRLIAMRADAGVRVELSDEVLRKRVS